MFSQQRSPSSLWLSAQKQLSRMEVDDLVIRTFDNFQFSPADEFAFAHMCLLIRRRRKRTLPPGVYPFRRIAVSELSSRVRALYRASEIAVSTGSITSRRGDRPFTWFPRYRDRYHPAKSRRRGFRPVVEALSRVYRVKTWQKGRVAESGRESKHPGIERRRRRRGGRRKTARRG